MEKNLILGRVVGIRDQGQIMFIDVKQSERVTAIQNWSNRAPSTQYVLESQLTKDFKNVKKQIYKGCNVQIVPTNFETKKGTKVKGVQTVKVVTKSNLFPRAFAQIITDQETRRANQLLCQIVNPSDYECMLARILIIQKVRDILRAKEALQIDLPTLEETYGGALAKPFHTFSTYNKKTYYLRVAHEFPCQRTIIGGISKMFTIGSCFRNESIDRTHTFQNLSMQYYSVHENILNMVDLVQQIFRLCYSSIHDSLNYNGFDLNLPWPIYGPHEINKLCITHAIHDGTLVQKTDALAKAHLLGPVYHLKGIEYCPLAKNETYESYVDYSMEIGTMYQQQNDKEVLVKNLKSLIPKQDGGQVLTNEDLIDKTFLKDLELGMPETVGLGMGLDRVVMAILHLKDIRDAQIQPKL